MAEGKAYYKDYDVEIPETLSAYGYGDSPLTFVSLSDYNGMRKLQGMDSVDLLENNYRILYNKENVRGLAEQFHDKSINLTIEESVLSPVNEAEEFTMSNSDMGQIIFVVADTWMKNMNVDTMIWNVQCVSEDAAKEFDTLLDNYQKKSKRECAFAYYVGKQLTEGFLSFSCHDPCHIRKLCKHFFSFKGNLRSSKPDIPAGQYLVDLR